MRGKFERLADQHSNEVNYDRQHDSHRVRTATPESAVNIGVTAM